MPSLSYRSTGGAGCHRELSFFILSLSCMSIVCMIDICGETAGVELVRSQGHAGGE
jgi:hypothetical protein